jgi:DNA/RNA endonuclease YhcR with UshA esterase domain
MSPVTNERKNINTSGGIIVVIIIIILVFALLGLILMYISATSLEPVFVDIAEIRETYNKAMVKIEGTVTSFKLNEVTGSFELEIEDKSGSISASSSHLSEFKELGNLPQIGDRIEITGLIHVNAKDGKLIYLNWPSKVKFIKAADNLN